MIIPAVLAETIRQRMPHLSYEDREQLAILFSELASGAIHAAAGMAAERPNIRSDKAWSSAWADERQAANPSIRTAAQDAKRAHRQCPWREPLGEVGDVYRCQHGKLFEQIRETARTHPDGGLLEPWDELGPVYSPIRYWRARRALREQVGAYVISPEDFERARLAFKAAWESANAAEVASGARTTSGLLAALEAIDVTVEGR